MSQVNLTTREEYLIAVNAFWQFYKKHHYSYPNQFKHYLSQSKHYNSLIYMELHDKWTLIKRDEFLQSAFDLTVNNNG